MLLHHPFMFAVCLFGNECLLHWLNVKCLDQHAGGKINSFPLKRDSNYRVVVAHKLCLFLKRLFNASMILAVKPQNQSIELF